MKPLNNIPKVLFLGLVLFLSIGGTVAITRVGQGAAPQGIIQDMIDAAPDGGTVNIPSGTYSETLLVDKNLTLKGVSLSETILQPAASDQRVIKVTDGHNLRLESLRVTGGHPDGSDDNAGGGVLLVGGSLELDHVQIDHNQASYGGGVYQAGSDGSVTASNCMIDDNSASFSGGGLFTEGTASLTYVLLQNNTASNHGGGMHVNSGLAYLFSGAVTGNHALDGNGGGVNVADDLTVIGTLFYNNTAGGTGDGAGSGGAITQWNSGKTVSIDGAVFSGNLAQINGGAVYIRESFLTLSNSTFTDNTADSGSSPINTFGGGVYAGGGLDGSFLTFNNNAAVCTSCAGSDGGGLYINRPSTGTSSVTQSTFYGNLAWIGSGIHSDTTVQLTLTNCNFVDNGNLTSGLMPSGYGGGVKASWLHGDQLLFQNNKVMNYGGGLQADESVLTNSRFIGNFTDTYGGGITSSGSFSGTNLLFDGNDAGYGSALYIELGSAVLHHATIGRSTHGTGSAIDIWYGTTLELKNSIITAYDNGVEIDGTLNEDYNLLFDNDTDFLIYGTYNPGGHSLSDEDPLFVAPAIGDFHLRRYSPAVGLGANLGVTVDLDSRPRINRWDSGAYQYYTLICLPVIRR